MSMAPECDKVLLVLAALDGELDAAQAAALAAHRIDCPICQAAAAELERARALIDQAQLYQRTPDALRRRISEQIAAAQPTAAPSDWPRRADRFVEWWRSMIGFGLGAACAAAITLLVVTPRGPDIATEVVAGHIRALQPGHLEDVASSDQHTVKPWFDGRIDFAPPVKDLAAARFPLIGGRLDYAANQPVAALVYHHDKHIINLFIWPADGAPAAPESGERLGYNFVHWSQNGMALWAVSDVEAGQLHEFAEVWRRSP